MNLLRYGRKSTITCMILFFIAGIIGVATSNALAVRAGFILAIISAVCVIIMTLKLQGEVECKK